MNKVSVIIPTKNAGPLFQQVLKAVVEQKTSWPYEVIVIDSGSADGTVEYVRQYPAVKLLEIKPHEFCHGRTRNVAISQSTGEFIAMLTHDALPASENWLMELVNTAEQDSAIAGVFGRHVAYPHASPFIQYEIEKHFAAFQPFPKVQLEDKERYAREEKYRQFLHFFSDNNALLRKSVWEKIPYPDVHFAEDQIWAQKIIEAGYVKAYAHNAVVYHSHDYSLLNKFRQSFDESLALKQLFNYDMCRNFRRCIRTTLALTRRDLMCAYKNKLWKTHLTLIVRSPLDNFMRVLGRYIGNHGERLPQRTFNFLSRYKREKEGLSIKKTKVN